MNNRITELTNLINKYRNAYYNENTSLISDEEYDKLYDELDELTKKYQDELIHAADFLAAREAIDKVGYEVVSELPTVKHNHPLLSLDKTKLSEDVVKFANNNPVLIMPKMDGLTCTLRYIDGKLESAITRGNGEEGELITHNARAMQSIPNEINTITHEVIIDGELMVTYQDFNRVNQELLDAGVPESELFANPRSMAAGTARQLDSSVCVHRNLKFVAWKCYKGPDTDDFNIRLRWLERMGFETVEWIYDNNLDVNSFERYVKIIKLWAKDNDYKIDGCVIGYNSITYGEFLGYTSHHPRNQIAFKFYDDLYPTILRDVKWTLGKTGVITPTAIFDTVEIDGTSVKQASMHNLTIMKNLKASIGKPCHVFKANMIIPQIDHFDSEEFDLAIPKQCPICKHLTEIVKEKNTEVLMCTNYNCSGTMLNKLQTFVGKSGMDIDGLGGATLELFWNKGYIRTFVDIYKFMDTYSLNIANLEGWTMTSVMKLSDSISRSRYVRLDKFITALSIPNVGSGIAKTIAEYCDWDIDNFLAKLKCKFNWSIIKGFGQKLSDGINNWYMNNSFTLYSLIDELIFEKPEVTASNTHSNSKVCEKTFCITGTFNESREVLKKKIEALGGIFVSSVSKNTDILFVGDKAGSKLDKAKKLGVTIYNENDLMEILNEGAN
ncbi:MAG: NAD-dependent DNA ligase LigA [Acholeplasmatales bacterium]|nr:NAD-dependent DNA ligase LigA [Acholeplasmatales bacterium]